MILSPIIRTFASALILGLLCASSFAEGGKEEMHLMTYRVPRDTFFLPDSAKEPQPITGVSLLRGEWPAATYDVHEFLKASVGLTFPPGAEAIFVNKSSFLLLRNTSANLELADIVFGAENYPPNTVRLEVEVVSFNLPGDLLNKPPQTLAELRKAAAGSWRRSPRPGSPSSPWPCPPRSWRPNCARAAGSTWRIACCGATSPRSTPGR